MASINLLPALLTHSSQVTSKEPACFLFPAFPNIVHSQHSKSTASYNIQIHQESSNPSSYLILPLLPQPSKPKNKNKKIHQILPPLWWAIHGSTAWANSFCSSLRKLPVASERQMRPRELVTKMEDNGTPAWRGNPGKCAGLLSPQI